MKVIITGGGTGGHVYPALSIADELKKKYSKVEILFIGTNRGLESDVVPKAGYDFKTIEVKGFRRKLSIDTFKTIGVMFKGYFQAGKLIKQFKPDIIIGTGGYVAGPVMLQGALRGIKTVIHEQNAIPGVTVKILSRFVNKVLLSYEESESYFKKRSHLIVTGNPVRKAFSNLEKSACRNKLGLTHPTIFSVGGSGGAMCINNAALSLIEHYNGKNVHVIHVTGKRYYDDFMKLIEEKNIKLDSNIQVLKYVYNMPDYMVSSDLMVSRSGALSLSEIAMVGTPSILIPSPNVAHNHQEHNARVYEKNGAAIMLVEKELKENTVYQIVEEHLFNKDHLSIMSKNAKALATPNATKEIIEVVDDMLRG